MFNPAHSEEMGFVPLGTCEWNRSLLRFQKTEKFCCGKYPQRYTHPGKHFRYSDKKGVSFNRVGRNVGLKVQGHLLIMLNKSFGLVKRDVA